MAEGSEILNLSWLGCALRIEVGAHYSTALLEHLRFDFEPMIVGTAMRNFAEIEVVDAKPRPPSTLPLFRFRGASVGVSWGARWIRYPDGSVVQITRVRKTLRVRLFAVSLESAQTRLTLLIYAVLGEALERAGYLRIHGLGIETDQAAVALMAPSGTGKSTLAFQLLKCHTNKVYSDEITLLKDGQVYPFPSRLAVAPELAPDARHFFGRKALVRIPPDRIAEPAVLNRIYLMERGRQDVWAIAPLTVFQKIRFLGQLTIGWHLPQILELSLRFDSFWFVTQMICRRFFIGVQLLWQRKVLALSLANGPEKVVLASQVPGLMMELNKRDEKRFETTPHPDHVAIVEGFGTQPWTWVFFLVAALALIGKIYLAHEDVLWTDEMTALHFARHPWWRAVMWDSAPPTFYVFLKGWAKFAESDFQLKLLPVVFSALTPWVMYSVVKRRFGQWTGNLALLFSSLHIVSFYYATELRTYSLAELMSAIQIFYFLKASEAKSLRGYLLSSVGVLMTHYLASLLILAQLIALMIRAPRLRRKLLPAIGAMGILAMAVWSSLKSAAFSFLAPGNLMDFWKAPLELFYNLNGHSKLLAAFTLVAIVGARRRTPQVVVVMGVCLLLTWPIGLITGLVPIYERFFIFLIPYFVVVWAVFVSRFQRRSAMVAGIFPGVAIFAAVAINHARLGIARSGWKAAAQAIPVDADNVVLIYGQPGVRQPYFSHHHVAIFYVNRSEDLGLAVATAKHVWILFPTDSEQSPKVKAAHSMVTARGFVRDSGGVFLPSASQPVGYVRFSK